VFDIYKETSLYINNSVSFFYNHGKKSILRNKIKIRACYGNRKRKKGGEVINMSKTPEKPQNSGITTFFSFCDLLVCLSSYNV
jgi:hypothetical protein